MPCRKGVHLRPIMRHHRHLAANLGFWLSSKEKKLHVTRIYNTSSRWTVAGQSHFWICRAFATFLLLQNVGHDQSYETVYYSPAHTLYIMGSNPASPSPAIRVMLLSIPASFYFDFPSPRYPFQISEFAQPISGNRNILRSCWLCSNESRYALKPKCLCKGVCSSNIQ